MDDAIDGKARLTASCACGKVEIEALGRPIATAVCYCDDCQAAGDGAPAYRGYPARLLLGLLTARMAMMFSGRAAAPAPRRSGRR